MNAEKSITSIIGIRNIAPAIILYTASVSATNLTNSIDPKR